MSSEQLADGVNPLDAELAATWDVLKGYSGRDTDLGIARRFGGSAAAYSLRDIGAMNNRVVKVRRDLDGEEADPEEDFSANQVSSGALENWVNGKLESTLPADVATAAAAYSLRKVSSNSNVYTGDYSSDANGIISPAANSAVTVTGNIDGISDGSTSKDNVLKIENNSTICPQLSLVRDNYQLTRSGKVTFTYYVPSGHPIIGKFWQIGSHDAGANAGSRGARIRTNIGVQIVGGTWTEVTLSYGSQYGGTDKFTDAFGAEFITITNEAEPNVLPFVEATADDGDIYYISAISVSATPLFPLRIRRSSDEVEVNVAFDSDNKISNSSLVENETEQGGESGQTTDTTLGDFISGTDAFVHTWYDQAGSNNAVQETDTNQPKIASNGVLLADGLDFDGSNDSLGLTSALGATTVQSIFSVQKNDITSGGTLLFDNRDANDDGSAIFATDTAGNKQSSWDGADAEHTAGTNEELISLIKTSSAIKIIANAVERGSIASSSTIDISNAPKIGASLADANHYDGSIKEIICYNSDQSNNRFKIESNINNYYGLYNDEYEWDDAVNTEWQNNVTDGATTFTANGKDGFTITATGENKSSFKYAITSPSSASNDYYKVSFNVDDPDGLFTTAFLRLTATGSGATAQAITNGFNSMSLRTGANFEYMSINSDASGSSKTATLSDFKISRIARNGFVETWYDQSGNSNNATQTSAGDQPNIVSNGGIIKNANGNPSLEFDGSGKHLEYGNVTSNINTISSFIYLERTAASGAEIVTSQGSSATTPASRWYTPFFNSAVAYLGYGATGSTALNLGTVSTFTPTLLSFACGESDVEGFANGTSKGTTTLEDASTTSVTNDDIGKFGTSGGFEYTGRITEYFIYASKLQSDVDTINDEINNHYNIY